MSRKASVIIVDDVGALRALLRIILEESGIFEVVAEGRDGEEAVNLTSSHQPDLVLLDLSMPKMDGAEALPLILRASPLTKVVVFSGLSEARLGSQLLARGASAYIEKGAGPEDIVERLSRVLGIDASSPTAWRRSR